MPDVLNYAATKTRRRLNEKIDWDLLGLSVVQIALWVWYLCRHYYVREFWGDRWSLFGFAWYYDRTNSYDPIVGVAVSLIVTLTACLPIAKRVVGYRIYLSLILLANFLHILSGEYILHQCPGVWGSLLKSDGQEWDYAGPSWILLLQPAFWVLLARSLTPRKWESVALQILVYPLAVIGLIGLICMFGLFVHWMMS